MCGRFAYFGNSSFGDESLYLPEPPPFESYNIFPTQNILAIRSSPATGKVEYANLRWGLLPSWSIEAKNKFTLINARAEGIEKKPSFREPFKLRRCIIPASGFFEWKVIEGLKHPFFIRPNDGGYFALAGIWDHWEGKDGQVVNSCAIITTGANVLMREIHDRMPVILKRENVSRWLKSHAEQDELLAMLEPYLDGSMEVYPVSGKVNNPRNNGPECVAK